MALLAGCILRDPGRIANREPSDLATDTSALCLMNGKDRFLDAASAIGERLCAEAIVHEEQALWSGAKMAIVEGEWQAIEATVGADLHGGTAGVGLFLGRLGSITGNTQFAQCAVQALRHAVGSASSVDGSLYGGTIGIIGAAIEVADLLDAPELEHAADKLLMPTPAPAGLIAGTAGMIIGALGLHRRRPAAGWLERATGWGAHLLARSETNGDGSHRWWPPGNHGNEPAPLGLAHGCAGCAWALGELAAVTQRGDLFESAMQVVSYERSWFDPDRGNWPDLQSIAPHDDVTENQPMWPAAWHDGSAGIGLTRLRLHQISGDRRLADEATMAMASAQHFAFEMAHQPPLHDTSLGHGLAGVIELLRTGASVLADSDLAHGAAAVADAAIELGSPLWPSAVRGGGESPGLMHGMAGIGSALLNLAVAEPAPVGLLWAGTDDLIG